MKTIKCDRCGEIIPPTSPWANAAKNGIIPPRLTITMFFGSTNTFREVDLCETCKSAVYNYIFDYGNGDGA